MMINVGIVDDHTVVINGLRNMLQSFSHINVSNVYHNGAELLTQLKKEVPDVLLMDIKLPDIDGDELTEQISVAYPQVKIIAMTGFSTTYYIRAMLDKGAAGYLLKNTDENILVKAIETVYRGGQYIDPSLSQQLVWSLLQEKKNEGIKPTLTRKEIEVLKLIAEGLTSKEIAEKLFISIRTVENHRVRLLHKFDVKNTVTLVKQALQIGLIG